VNYLNPRFIPRVDPSPDPFSATCLDRLRDWADSVEDPGSARFDKDLLGVGGDAASPPHERRNQ
jgi:hypothetical protein